ncbi:MAG TPA: glycosyltransferase family 4 protein [Gaiellaceae bacterium]|nr:glycosyltransferase family 4 protein [Gaiellaceae bacterium]
MRVLLVTMYFPPAGGGGVARPTKLAGHLADLGFEVHVLAPDDSKWLYRDDVLAIPPNVQVHRAKYVGPKGRLPAEELHGLDGLDRALRQAGLFSRRLLVPDEFVSWGLTAIPAARRIVRDEKIDVLVTTSPPASVNLIGASVKQVTGVYWVADLRDSVAANPDRRVDRLAVRMKEQTQEAVAKLVARWADAVVTVSDAISSEMLALGAERVETIPNGCDFEDFQGLEYHRDERFRITHTGTFFGHRDPRPFLSALAEVEGDVVARFVGGLRSSDREFAESLGLGDKIEEIEHVPRQSALELQRDSDALLLLLPEAGGRGKTVPSGKIYEYLAAERPILAAVPPDGVAAELVRRSDAGVVVAPDDVAALKAAISGLRARWERGALENGNLPQELKDELSRRTRSREFADLLEDVA